MWLFPSIALAVATAELDAAENRETTVDQAAPIGVRPPIRSDRAIAVSPDDALSLATSYRCVSLLSTMVSGLALYAERGGKRMASVPALLRKPCIDEPVRDTLASSVASLALFGNCYWLLVRGGPNEQASSIQVLDPASVVIENDATTGERVYKRLTSNGNWVTFPAWQRSHLRLLRVPGKAYGLGPVQAGQAELRGAIDLRDYAAFWFAGSTAIPQAGYLSTEQPLSRSEVEQYRSQLEQLHQDGRIPVFGNGVKLILTKLTPQEALWTEAQSHYSATIARAFGVPTTLLDERSGGSETYSNVSDRAAVLITQTLSSYTEEISSAFSELLPAGTVARFDTSTLFAAVQGQASAKDNSVATTTDTSTAPAEQPGNADA